MQDRAALGEDLARRVLTQAATWKRDGNSNPILAAVLGRAADDVRELVKTDWEGLPLTYATFTGDHAAIEQWAADTWHAWTGELPARAVFEGDCHGVYLNPERLQAMGIPSRLTTRVHVPPGSRIDFDGEFTVELAAEITRPCIGVGQAAPDHAGQVQAR